MKTAQEYAKTAPQDPIEWLTFILTPHARTASLTLKARTFVYGGLKFKCCNGPWCESLEEAILTYQKNARSPKQ